MKKIYFAALVMMTGFAMNANAQAQTDNDVIQGKAEVVAFVNVTGVNALEFGMVSPGVPKTISAEGTVLQGTAGNATTNGAEQIGTFTITKGINTSVTLHLTSPGNLTNGGNNLPINFADYLTNKLGLLTGSTDVPFSPTSDVVIDNSTTYGNYFSASSFGVSIGGTVVPSNTLAAGEYTGTITLTATYN